MDQNQERRRGQFHRGRRGPDRRGSERSERRTTSAQGPEHSGRDHVDVEQIMRDIRARIGPRQGIDLTNQQIQELAARRLEAILDPRSIKPGLLDELRRSAGSPLPSPDPAEPAGLSYSFEDTTLYESHRGILVFFRKLLNPILKLFFNPNPLIHALNIQSRWNTETSRRLVERDRRQTEWNALHYELLQRMVSEVSKVSLELQSLSGQIESLSAKVDFNDRRVRNMEAAYQTRPTVKVTEPVVSGGAAGPEAPSAAMTPEGQSSEATRRRRRRRRGRRGSGASADGAAGVVSQPAASEAVAGTGIEAYEDPGSEEDVEEEGATATEPAPPPLESAAASAPEPRAPGETLAPDPAPPAPDPEPPEPQG